MKSPSVAAALCLIAVADRLSCVVSGVSLIERIDSRRSFRDPRRTAPDHGDDHTRHAMSEGVGEEYPRRGGQRTDP